MIKLVGFNISGIPNHDDMIVGSTTKWEKVSKNRAAKGRLDRRINTKQ